MAKKPQHAEAGVAQRAASPTAERDTLHTALRMLYLLISSAALPLSIVHLKLHHREHLMTVGPGMGLVLVLGAIFWCLFYIAFGQRYFPLNRRRALVTLGAILANGIVASRLRPFDALYGAYSIMLASLTAQVIYFSRMTLLFLLPAKRSNYFHYTDAWYIAVPLTAALTTGLCLAYLGGPALAAVRAASSFWWTLLYGAVFLFDVAQYVRWYAERNLFVYDQEPERAVRDDVLIVWGLPIVLAMITSIMAAMAVIALL